MCCCTDRSLLQSLCLWIKVQAAQISNFHRSIDSKCRIKMLQWRAHTQGWNSVCVSLRTSLHDNNIITTLRPKITPYTVTDCINSEIHNLDKNCRICLKTVCTFPHYTLCKQQYVTKVWCRKTNKYHRLTIICRWRTAWDFGHFVVILWDRSIQTVL